MLVHYRCWSTIDAGLHFDRYRSDHVLNTCKEKKKVLLVSVIQKDSMITRFTAQYNTRSPKSTRAKNQKTKRPKDQNARKPIEDKPSLEKLQKKRKVIVCDFKKDSIVT